MADLRLRSVRFNLQKEYPTYVISSVIDADWGHKGVKLIQSPEELDLYYGGIKDRQGLLELLESGSSLLLTRLKRTGSQSPTLRLYKGDFKYSHPNVFDFNDYEYQSINSDKPITITELDENDNLLREYTQKIDKTESFNFTPGSGIYKFIISFYPVNKLTSEEKTIIEVEYFSKDSIWISYSTYPYYTLDKFTGEFTINNADSELVNLDPSNHPLIKGEPKTLVNKDLLYKSDFHKRVNLYSQLTYNFKIDFSQSSVNDEDVFLLPSYVPNNVDRDNNIVFYFIDFNDPKYPTYFEEKVTVSALGGGNGSNTVYLGINTNKVNSPEDRAEILYNWFTGNLSNDSTMFISSIDLDSKALPDPYVIPELCSFDNGELTIVYKNPVRDIEYYKSSSVNPIEVVIDDKLNQDLISRAGRDNAAVSFESLVLGDVSIKITLQYVKRYEFNLEVQFNDLFETYYVSLDRNSELYQGESLFIEEVINVQSEIIKCKIHLGQDIDSGVFTEDDCKNLSGEYELYNGHKGENLPTFEEGELVYPFEKSVDDLILSEKLSNLFMFNDQNNIRFQKYCLDNYLKPNTTLGFVNVDEEELDYKILNDSDREFIYYFYGEASKFNTSYFVRNSYISANSCINGDFKSKTIDNTIPEIPSLELQEVLDSKAVNYLEVNKDYYFINKIVNLEGYTEPHYMLVGNFIKIYMTRFLKRNLGLFSEELEDITRKELPKVSLYSSLIKTLDISQFNVEGNNVNVIIKAELYGLVGKVFDIFIKIDKQ